MSERPVWLYDMALYKSMYISTYSAVLRGMSPCYVIVIVIVFCQ